MLGDLVRALFTIRQRRETAVASAAGAVIVWSMSGDELLRLSCHHTAVPPVIEERPGRYLGYFVNKLGEQLVFVHDDGDPHGTLFHGDVGWVSYRITDVDGRPDAGDLILNREEWAFVIACWIATAWRRGAETGRSAA